MYYGRLNEAPYVVALPEYEQTLIAANARELKRMAKKNKWLLIVMSIVFWPFAYAYVWGVGVAAMLSGFYILPASFIGMSYGTFGIWVSWLPLSCYVAIVGIRKIAKAQEDLQDFKLQWFEQIRN